MLQRQQHGGQPGRSENHRQRSFGRLHDGQRRLEPCLDRARERVQVAVRRQVGGRVLVVHHEHIVPGDAQQVGGDGDPSRLVAAARTGGIPHRRLRHLPLDGHVHLAAVARQPLDQAAAHLDQLIERRIRRAVEKRGDVGEGGRRWKGQVESLSQLRRGTGAIDQRGHVGRRRGRAGDPDAPARQQPEIDP